MTRAFQAQTGVVEETPTVDLAIISIFLFPFTAALLSREGTNECVWDREAPKTGLVTKHDFRKSELQDLER